MRDDRRVLVRSARRVWQTLRTDFRERILQDAGVVMFGHVLRLGLGVISSALLARSLGPAGLSLFTVVGVVMGIGRTAADLGLRLTAIRHIAPLQGDPTRAQHTAAIYLRLKTLAGLAAALLVFVLAAPLARLLNLPEAGGATLLRLGSLGLFATAAGSAISTIQHALSRFRPLVLMQLATILLTVLLMAAFWWRSQLTIQVALVIGAVAAGGAAALGFALLPPGWLAALRRPVPLSDPQTGRLLRFSRWMWLSSIFSILAVQVDVLLLNYLLPPPLVGIYVLARSLGQKVDTVHQTLYTILLPNVSALDGAAAQRGYWQRSLIRSALLAGAILLAAPLAGPFIRLVYGSEFAASVNVFYALLAVVILDLLVSPLILLALPMDRPRLLAAADGLQVVVLLGAGLALVPIWGVYGIVAARLAARLASALVALPPLLRRIRQQPAT